jgi:acetyl esterase
MPLNPQAEAFLALGAAAGLPHLVDQGAYVARSNSHAEPDLGGALNPRVEIKDRFFTSSTADIPMHIYTPKGPGPFNALVYFHGGGWVINYIGKYDAQLSDMAEKINSVIISINYQKAPEHKFPTPFNDCYEGLEWVVNHASELNINIEKIGVGGDSAGGNLASAVALAARDKGKIKLAYQWLVYPCNGPEFVDSPDIPNATDFGLDQRGMKWLWEQYINPSDRTNPYAVPHAAESFAGLPPTVIITAEYDVLRADGIAYRDKLIAAGVKVAYKDCPGMIHGFFNYGKYIDEGIKIRDYFADEINNILGA